MEAAAGEVILLDFWASPFGMRVRIALAEKGIKYEYKEDNLVENKSPLLIQMNPVHKSVPVLIHNGKPISESLIIVQYIDEVWNQHSPPILPSHDPHQLSVARFWADYVDKKVYVNGRRLCFGKEEEEVEKAKEELIEGLKALEGELGEKAYFGGERFGLVDIALVPFSNLFYTYQTCGNVEVESEVPKLVAWKRRCLMRESVSKSLPDPIKICEFILGIRKMFGIE